MVDATEWWPQEPVDVLVSNAMLQWIPDHANLLLPWSETIGPGGTLAFQLPGNFGAPSHQLLWQTAARRVLQALPDTVREDFVVDYKAALREAYPRQSLRTVLPFRRSSWWRTAPARRPGGG